MKRIPLLAAFAVVALAALAAGCGGDGGKSGNKGGGGGGEAALTRPEAKDPYKGKTNAKTTEADVAEGKKAVTHVEGGQVFYIRWDHIGRPVLAT